MRGTGTTTQQIKAAPEGAYYIWLNYHTEYPKKIAAELGRNDITFVSPTWLLTEGWRGKPDIDIIVDHAVGLSSQEYAAYLQAMAYYNKYTKKVHRKRT